MKIVIICDVCTADFTSPYNGGRESYIRSIYRIAQEKNIELKELFFEGNPQEEKKFGNVEYVKIKKNSEIKDNISEDDILYFNVYFHSSRGSTTKLIKFLAENKNYKVLQQHNAYYAYPWRNRRFEEIVPHFEEIFFYSPEDMEEWAKKGKVANSFFLIASEKYDDMKFKKFDNGNIILYSGRPSPKLIRETIEYKTLIENAGFTLKFSFINLNKKAEKLIKKYNLNYTVGDTEDERYKGVCLLIQTDHKGYGLSIIESLKFGIPSAIKYDWACSKYFVPSKDFIFKNSNGLNTILKMISSKDFTKETKKLSMNFDGENEKALARLTELLERKK